MRLTLLAPEPSLSYRSIRDESPATQIVVLTMQNEPAYARQALTAGALGYVLKEAAEEELVEAIERAAVGDTYLNPRLGARVAVRSTSSSRATSRPAWDGSPGRTVETMLSPTRVDPDLSPGIFLLTPNG